MKALVPGPLEGDPLCRLANALLREPVVPVYQSPEFPRAIGNPQSSLVAHVFLPTAAERFQQYQRCFIQLFVDIGRGTANAAYQHGLDVYYC